MLLNKVRVGVLWQLCLFTIVSEGVMGGDTMPRVGDWQRQLDRIGKVRMGFIKTKAGNSLSLLNL